MSKLRMALFAVVGVLASAAPTLAQAGGVAADNEFSVSKYKALAAGLGFALAAAEGVARNPGAGARIQTMMILGLVFIETLVLFTLVVVFAALR